jgi:general stress protein 26
MIKSNTTWMMSWFDFHAENKLKMKDAICYSLTLTSNEQYCKMKMALYIELEQSKLQALSDNKWNSS